MSILIKDTTKEERAKIVEESIGNIAGACDGVQCRYCGNVSRLY